jgi:hypothetical protein
VAPKRGHRWYDQYPPLAALLEQLKDLPQAQVSTIVRGLRDVIVVESPGLIDRTVLDYPLDETDRRRWYDFDPICWLTVNAMRHCDENAIVKCIAYLRDALSDRELARSTV